MLRQVRDNVETMLRERWEHVEISDNVETMLRQYGGGGLLPCILFRFPSSGMGVVFVRGAWPRCFEWRRLVCVNVGSVVRQGLELSRWAVASKLGALHHLVWHLGAFGACFDSGLIRKFGK